MLLIGVILLLQFVANKTKKKTDGKLEKEKPDKLFSSPEIVWTTRGKESIIEAIIISKKVLSNVWQIINNIKHRYTWTRKEKG